MIKAVLVSVLLFGVVSSVSAAEKAGVELPDSVRLEGAGQALVLNGIGVRSKFIIDVYVAGLYLPQAESDARTVIGSGWANRVTMHFVYSKVSRDAMADAWRDGFEANLDRAALAGMESRLASFIAMFPDLTEGSVVHLDYLPGRGTRVMIDSREAGIVEGADFNAALLSVWLGEDPVTDSLKEALLGADRS